MFLEGQKVLKVVTEDKQKSVPEFGLNMKADRPNANKGCFLSLQKKGTKKNPFQLKPTCNKRHKKNELHLDTILRVNAENHAVFFCNMYCRSCINVACVYHLYIYSIMFCKIRKI